MTRDDEITRRSKAAMARLTPPSLEESTYLTKAKAMHAARRCHLANTEIDAVMTSRGWVGVIYLRSDQQWMAKIIKEHGCRVMEKKL